MSAALFAEIIDRLDRIEAKLADRSNVEQLWLDKRDLAAALGMSVRWVEDRMPEGMPYRRLGASVRFNLSEVENWLRKRGTMKESA